jgi:purine-binding chemotaxis protein CheW
MARRDGDFLILLDVGKVLSISEMVSLGDAARAGGHSEDQPEPPEGL